jgi:hypothetical protein
VEKLTHLAGFKMIPLAGISAGSDTVEVDSRIQILRVFAGGIAFLARVMALAHSGLSWSPNMVRRVAHDLIDAARKEPDLLLGLLHLPVAQSRLGTHLVRVAVLAILCADKLGLPKKAQAEVAMIAFCHHLSQPDEEIFRSEEDLDLDELAPTRRTDPLAAALALCARGCLNEDLVRRVVGVYEATGAAGGQRELYRKSGPASDLLGRIVLLADRYVVLLDALQPDEALRVLLAELREREPDLTRIFVNAVGLYPVGTIVSLQSGARAVVVEAPRRKQQLLRPVVQLIDGGLIDLSRDDRGHGAIVGTLAPETAAVNVTHFFLL